MITIERPNSPPLEPGQRLERALFVVALEPDEVSWEQHQRVGSAYGFFLRTAPPRFGR